MHTNEWPEITVNTTLDELKEIHKRIWNYAIEHGRKPDTPYSCNCACCEYSLLRFVESGCILRWWCHYCPLGEELCCEGGLYSKWISATKNDPEEAKHLATLIRDAPFVSPDRSRIFPLLI